MINTSVLTRSMINTNTPLQANKGKRKVSKTPARKPLGTFCPPLFLNREYSLEKEPISRIRISRKLQNYKQESVIDSPETPSSDPDQSESNQSAQVFPQNNWSKKYTTEDRKEERNPEWKGQYLMNIISRMNQNSGSKERGHFADDVEITDGQVFRNFGLEELRLDTLKEHSKASCISVSDQSGYSLSGNIRKKSMKVCSIREEQGTYSPGNIFELDKQNNSPRCKTPKFLNQSERSQDSRKSSRDPPSPALPVVPQTIFSPKIMMSRSKGGKRLQIRKYGSKFTFLDYPPSTWSLVLGLDETLIFEESLQHTHKAKSPKSLPTPKNIILRPYAEQLLNEAHKKYKIELILYTTRRAREVGEVLQNVNLDSEIFSGIIARDNCMMLGDGEWVKDIGLIAGRDKNRLIIIDGQVHKWPFHTMQVVPILPFFGDPADILLSNLSLYLFGGGGLGDSDPWEGHIPDVHKLKSLLPS